MSDEIGNIEAVRATKGMFGTILQNFLLSFFVGVFSFLATWAYDVSGFDDNLQQIFQTENSTLGKAMYDQGVDSAAGAL